MVRLLENQPRPDERFYVRADAEARPITEFTDEKAPFFVVDTRRKHQFYLYYGFPWLRWGSSMRPPETNDMSGVEHGATIFCFTAQRTDSACPRAARWAKDAVIAGFLSFLTFRPRS